MTNKFNWQLARTGGVLSLGRQAWPVRRGSQLRTGRAVINRMTDDQQRLGGTPSALGGLYE